MGDDDCSALAELVCGVVAEVCDLPGCAPDDRLADLGVDSVRAAEAAAVLEDALGVGIPLEAVFAAGTPAALAQLLAKTDDHG